MESVVIALGEETTPSEFDSMSVKTAIASPEASVDTLKPSASSRKGKRSSAKRRKSAAIDPSLQPVVSEGSPSSTATAIAEAPVGATSSAVMTDAVLAGAQNDDVDDHKLSHLEVEFVSLEALAVRTKGLFEWVDGPLVTAMRNGEIILLDELSLADDAVLERLNSVLEPGRSITLAEKGGEGALDGQGAAEVVVASPGFRYSF